MFSDIVAMVMASIQAVFEWQGLIWDQYGVLVTFLFVFVAATFFRFIVVRMFGAGAAGASDSVRDSRHE